jgi:hypothetical protein
MAAQLPCLLMLCCRALCQKCEVGPVECSALLLSRSNTISYYSACRLCQREPAETMDEPYRYSEPSIPLQRCQEIERLLAHTHMDGPLIFYHAESSPGTEANTSRPGGGNGQIPSIGGIRCKGQDCLRHVSRGRISVSHLL